MKWLKRLFNWSSSTRRKWTKLHLAAAHGNADDVRRLLARGYSVDQRDDKGDTPLRISPSVEVSRQLLAKGADVNVTNDSGLTPIHKACHICNAALLHLYLEYGAHVNVESDNGTTPLITAANASQVYQMAVLVKAGASAGFVNSLGQSACTHGATGGMGELCNCLVALEAISRANSIDMNQVQIVRTKLIELMDSTMLCGVVPPGDNVLANNLSDHWDREMRNRATELWHKLGSFDKSMIISGNRIWPAVRPPRFGRVAFDAQVEDHKTLENQSSTSIVETTNPSVDEMLRWPKDMLKTVSEDKTNGQNEPSSLAPNSKSWRRDHKLDNAIDDKNKLESHAIQSKTNLFRQRTLPSAPARAALLSVAERDGMRNAGRFNAELMDVVRSLIRPGITTGQIDSIVFDYTDSRGHVPASLNYNNFPKSCCTSINDEVCHGIPGERVLLEGDVLKVLIATRVDGWYAHSSETFLIGNASQEARKLTQCVLDCLFGAISAIQPGCRVSVIGEFVTAEATKRGFSVVREYVGHGVGRQSHQEPSIPNFPNRQARHDRLYPGVCFAIEPMINAGERNCVLDKANSWTVRTKDHSISAEFKHTILLTENGPEILTLTHNGPKAGHRF
jgi:methionyl aminopeptidase